MKKTATRDRLIRAGLELVHARSYAAVSVDDICRRARVNKGSFYHCFPAKADLAIAILNEQQEIYRAEIMGPAFDNALPPLEKIACAFSLMASFQKRVKAKRGKTLGCLFGNLALEMSSSDRRVRDCVRAGLARLEAAFERALRDAMVRGDLPEGDAARGAEQLVAYLQGLVLWSKVHDDPARMMRLALNPSTLALGGAGPGKRTEVASEPRMNAQAGAASR